MDNTILIIAAVVVILFLFTTKERFMIDLDDGWIDLDRRVLNIPPIQYTPGYYDVYNYYDVYPKESSVLTSFSPKCMRNIGSKEVNSDLYCVKGTTVQGKRIYYEPGENQKCDFLRNDYCGYICKEYPYGNDCGRCVGNCKY